MTKPGAGETKDPMAKDFLTDNPELEALYKKYEKAPDSHVFAPLADAYRKAGMVEEAAAICAKGVKKHPEYASGYVVQGKCLYDLGQIDEAEEAFREVLTLDHNNLVALKYIGLILAQRGGVAEAMKHFKHILALDPDNKEIRLKLEHLEAEGAEPRAVVDDGFEGEDISLGDDEGTSDELATTTLAEIYAQQGYTDKAIRIYREILKRQPDNEHVKRRLAELGEPAEILPQPENAEDVYFARPGEATKTGAVRTTEEEPLEELDEDEDKRPANATNKPSKAKDKTGGDAIDETRSYEQFKRWLKNLSD